MPPSDDGITQQLLAIFRDEAREHLQSLTQNLLTLERGTAPEDERVLLETTFRLVHTLKGAARSVAMSDVEVVCQGCELLLSRITRGRLTLTPSLIGVLQEAVDGIAALLQGDDPTLRRRLVGALDQARAEASGASEPAADRDLDAPAPEGASAPEPASIETIRLDPAKLDRLLVQGEELLAAKLAVEERSREAAALVDELSRSRQIVQRAYTERPPNGGDPGRAFEAVLAGEMRATEATARSLSERLARDRRAIGAAVDELLEQTRLARMMPVSTVLDLFPRMVRDLARNEGKEVEWSAHGRELDVDRRVLETIKDPLIHLVRNAIDHGIEPPDARAEAGKPVRGRVAVAVSLLEDARVEVSVEDDGRGMDPRRVRAAAVRSRLLPADAAEALGDDDTLDLVFRSGLSTSPVITDVSGHGLGLAIVREQVQRLEGEIRVATRPGAGTTVTMVLPSSIASFRGLLVRTAERLFLLPVGATDRVLSLAEDEIGLVEGRETIRWNGEAVPLAPLSAVLELAEEAANDGASRLCVIVRSGQQRVALVVDEVLGDREVLVKELRPPLVRVRNVAGAGLLGTGEIVLILRAGDLVAAGRRARRPPPSRVETRDEGRAPLVLVVDDAVTTRTMERNLLEAAGYRVKVAVDGVDAWTLLKREPFDLVVSDVDMRRMDGFELTTRIRADAGLRDLPVVLVTAHESRENKERGIEVGANAYVVKSSFEQSNLLEIIRRLGITAR